jgi:hypothetical protein
MAFLADGRSLEEIVQIIVKEPFAELFPRLRNPAAVVARCLVTSRSSARRYALGKALYGCPGLEMFWRSHGIQRFPEKLIVFAIDEEGQKFAFNGHEGSFFQSLQGDYTRLGGPPIAITPISQATDSIPAVMPAATCEYVVGMGVGPDAVKKLSTPDRFMLDGGLARGTLDVLERQHSINRRAMIVCWPDGMIAGPERVVYRLYARMLPVPRQLELCEKADHDVGVFLEPPVRSLRTLDFAASSRCKLYNIFYAMDGVLNQLAGFMDVPPRVEIEAEQARIACDLDCQPGLT